MILFNHQDRQESKFDYFFVILAKAGIFAFVVSDNMNLAVGQLKNKTGKTNSGGKLELQYLHKTLRPRKKFGISAKPQQAQGERKSDKNNSPKIRCN